MPAASTWEAAPCHSRRGMSQALRQLCLPPGHQQAKPVGASGYSSAKWEQKLGGEGVSEGFEAVRHSDLAKEQNSALALPPDSFHQ